jgi:hypothetical protein
MPACRRPDADGHAGGGGGEGDGRGEAEGGVGGEGGAGPQLGGAGLDDAADLVGAAGGIGGDRRGLGAAEAEEAVADVGGVEGDRQVHLPERAAATERDVVEEVGALADRGAAGPEVEEQGGLVVAVRQVEGLRCRRRGWRS